jgi:aspartate/methionine/tyrosine aminotransferase
MTRLNPVFVNRPVSIFPTMTALANKFDAVNLGQGFPDEDGPPEILKAAADAIIAGPNQYAPIEGVPALREAIAADQKRFYDLDFDWRTETLVLAGATEGLAAAFLAFCQPGDEVIVFAPFYESYAPQIEAAGARPVFVDLDPASWRIDPEKFEKSITGRTRAIIINTPHNPTGHVMGDDELAVIAAAAGKHDLIVICDEVYEHLILDGRRHEPLMTLPDMRKRCVRIGSFGKTFSLTGWRLGYAVGDAELIDALKKAHQFIAYTCPSHLQIAIAEALKLDDQYYRALQRTLAEKRDRLSLGLASAGLDVLPVEGGYFVNADIRSVGRDDDRAFCEEITAKAGVAAVPVSAFYHQGATNAPRHFARFCFSKKHAVLDEATRRLKTYFGGAG